MMNQDAGLEPEESAGSRAADITGVPWTVGDALMGIVLLLPVSVFAGLTIYLWGAILSWLWGFGVPSVLSIVSLGGATFFAGIGLAWWLGIRRRGGSPANLGFTDLRPWFDFPIAGLGEIIIFIGLATYGFILSKVAGLEVPQQPVIELFGRSTTGFVLAVIVVAILAPIGEEVFFRGFVYTAFRRQWGVRTAMIASAAVFALFHVTPLLFVPMFMIGLVLAGAFEYRRSLAPNIIMHSLNNLLALLALYKGIQ